MSYTDEVMSHLSRHLRNLNDAIPNIKELTDELEKANALKFIELGLQTGKMTTIEAKMLLEQYSRNNDDSKTKRK